jgi:alpha-glucoside transport system substrate-binding protein
MAEFARVGALIDLGTVIDQSSYKAETVPAFVNLGTVDGKLVGVFIKTTLKGLIWYDPKIYTVGTPTGWSDLWARVAVTANRSTRTWCLGLESGESSGWPGTDVIEDYLLRADGPEVYDDWVAGRLKWSSPQVRAAWEALGRMVAGDAVYGSPEIALTTSFMKAGNPLFSDPPGCLLLHGSTFMTQFFRSEAGARDGEYDFFPFPEVNPRYAGAVTGAGDLFGMFKDTPQARALMRYLVTADAQSIWVRRGGALSVNAKVTDYPDELSARAAHVLATAQTFRFDGSDLMPEAMNEAFWAAILEFTRDQSRLPHILEQLDVVQASAYSGY